MDKKEIIFFIIVIIAYILCSIFYNLPTFLHIIFVAILLIFLFVTVIMKYQKNFENQKISHAAKMISSILTIVFVMLIISGFVFKFALFMLYTPILILIFITLFIAWFFKKEEI